MYPKKIMLLGSGELGRELAIAAKRLGNQVIACDRYEGAPAMQVSDNYEVFDMTDPRELKSKVLKHKPDIIIPEIEALAVEALCEIENSGIKVVPNANATQITMNRDKIRDLASTKLGLKTTKYNYANSLEELQLVSKELTWPLIIKPIMSSSGKGQSLIKEEKEIKNAWEIAVKEARGKSSKVIVEELINFDLEITLLTIRQKDGSTLFCPPIGHTQVNGDYECSWQPADLTKAQLDQAKLMAKKITNELNGEGIFGVEFFLKENEIIFSEVSPRPHDTGLVTLTSQAINEFELHIRAILDLPINEIEVEKPSASHVILSKNSLSQIKVKGLKNALNQENTKVIIFGKPNAKKGRRLGVAIAQGQSIEEAIQKAQSASNAIEFYE